ncbi:MAG: hypothetical protein LN546_04215 [Rickettsia endosymbiont of Ecitomorpha arachnoides]|nr:hypothetical protein [Rickettsia endosymbiont of Ecitomorpha arachnoides]
MTGKPGHATMPRGNDIEQKRLGTIRSSHGMTPNGFPSPRSNTSPQK